MTRKVLLATGTAAMVVFATVAVEAATSRSSPVTRFAGIDEIVEACTNTSSFTTMPQMTRTFSLSAPGSVAAMFSGSLSLDSANAFDTGFLRLTIDNVQQSPGVVPAIAPGERGSHGFNWQSAPLAAGAHTAKVQWRTDLGNTFCADARSLLVLHR